METPDKSTSTPQSTKTKTNKVAKTPASKKVAIVAAPLVAATAILAAPAPSPAPVDLSYQSKRKTARVDDKNVEYVTNLGLRRQLISGETQRIGSFFVSADDYVQLNILSMKTRLTVDELVRGCITQALQCNDPVAGLKNYIPLLS